MLIDVNITECIETTGCSAFLDMHLTGWLDLVGLLEIIYYYNNSNVWAWYHGKFINSKIIVHYIDTTGFSVILLFRDHIKLKKKWSYELTILLLCERLWNNITYPLSTGLNFRFLVTYWTFYIIWGWKYLRNNCIFKCIKDKSHIHICVLNAEYPIIRYYIPNSIIIVYSIL